MIEKNPKAFRSEIYTNFSDLEKEINRRWNDKELRKKVEDFFGPKMLHLMIDKPHAVLSRSVGTPNLELKYFLDLVKEIKLDPLILEYNDKFVAISKDKYHLGRLFFFRILNGNKIIPVDTLNVVDFNKDEGKCFNLINTVWGENFIDFHHRLVLEESPELKDKMFDFSDWFNETRVLSKYYYFYYLSLFVCHGVLFENFLVGDKQELNFIEEKLLPSFREVERVFGVKPLIYPFLPFENEKSSVWLSYPESMQKMMGGRVKKRRSKLMNNLRHFWFFLRGKSKHV
ncbi:MAG: hypothetical protein WCW47_00325 [Candidatus Paceibacterota bacterium]|jgi:hypothetical protein